MRIFGSSMRLIKYSGAAELIHRAFSMGSTSLAVSSSNDAPKAWEIYRHRKIVLTETSVNYATVATGHGQFDEYVKYM